MVELGGDVFSGTDFGVGFDDASLPGVCGRWLLVVGIRVGWKAVGMVNRGPCFLRIVDYALGLSSSRWSDIESRCGVIKPSEEVIVEFCTFPKAVCCECVKTSCRKRSIW